MTGGTSPMSKAIGFAMVINLLTGPMFTGLFFFIFSSTEKCIQFRSMDRFLIILRPKTHKKDSRKSRSSCH